MPAWSKITLASLLFSAIIMTWACSHHRNAITPPDRRIGTEWLLEDLNGTGVVDGVQTTLKFDAADRISGSAGCNRYFATVQIEGADFKVGPIGSTKMMCPPAVSDQETAFFKSLENAQRFRFEDSFLLIDSLGQNKPLKFTRLNR
jgi:putative lipoprotein